MQKVKPEVVKAWLASGEAVLIDVREPAEFADLSIPGAKSLPLERVSAATLPPHVDKKLVLHCGGGTRAGKASAKLEAELPGIETYILEGGFRGWKAAGLPVQAGWYPLMPLEKQLRIIAGSAVLGGMILGFWVSGFFHLIAIAAGAGLLYSGLTSECRLMTLLSKLPFNGGKSYKEAVSCVVRRNSDQSGSPSTGNP